MPDRERDSGQSNEHESINDTNAIEPARPIRRPLSIEVAEEKARRSILEQMERDIDDPYIAVFHLCIPIHNTGPPRLHVIPTKDSLERLLRVTSTLPPEFTSALASAMEPKERAALNLLLRIEQARKTGKQHTRVRPILVAPQKVERKAPLDQSGDQSEPKGEIE